MKINYHNCGGTILTAENNCELYAYCDRCYAFAYYNEEDYPLGFTEMPDGTDYEKNKQAWDNADLNSPWE